VTFLEPNEYRSGLVTEVSVNIGPDGASLMLKA
jgi:hypothetical protein